MSGVAGFDHVSLPLVSASAMTAFYRALGLQVVETPYLVQVYAGTQMINFHQPSIWQQEGFTLRAPAATPPCGDLCFVWDGSSAELASVLRGAGAVIEEGPVARDGGRQQSGVSVYVRDPDGNLLEFLRYGEGGSHAG
jgi:catechol 2,3-dioxygenase-like lactoylglutathione lyase family enzyme